MPPRFRGNDLGLKHIKQMPKKTLGNVTMRHRLQTRKDRKEMILEEGPFGIAQPRLDEIHQQLTKLYLSMRQGLHLKLSSSIPARRMCCFSKNTWICSRTCNFQVIRFNLSLSCEQQMGKS
jgi:hypothetical protein